MNFQDIAANINPVTFWVVVGIFLIIAEMVSASFFLIFLATGCFMASLAAMMHIPWGGQVLAAIITSIIGTFFYANQSSGDF